MNKWRVFSKGLLRENPNLMLLLGMCPTLGVTTSLFNGLGMGLATTFVLLFSNMLISSIARFVPEQVHIPVYIVIIASFVSIVDLLIQGFLPALSESLGIYIPLIVVNCIVLGRAEAFASKHDVLDSMLDGLGMGLGFTFSLCVIGACRELLGSGSLWGHKIVAGDGILIFVLPPGAFFVLGFLIALIHYLQMKKN